MNPGGAGFFYCCSLMPPPLSPSIVGITQLTRAVLKREGDPAPWSLYRKVSPRFRKKFPLSSPFLLYLSKIMTGDQSTPEKTTA